jgi:hypothetical protein
MRMAEEKSITKLPRVIYISLCGTPITYDIDREIIIKHSHVSYSLGYVLCRLPAFMVMYKSSDWNVKLYLIKIILQIFTT